MPTLCGFHTAETACGPGHLTHYFCTRETGDRPVVGVDRNFFRLWRLESAGAEGDVTLRFEFPTEWHEFENAGYLEYAPQSITVSREVLAEVRAGSRTGTESDRELRNPGSILTSVRTIPSSENGRPLPRQLEPLIRSLAAVGAPRTSLLRTSRATAVMGSGREDVGPSAAQFYW